MRNADPLRMAEDGLATTHLPAALIGFGGGDRDREMHRENETEELTEQLGAFAALPEWFRFRQLLLVQGSL